MRLHASAAGSGVALLNAGGTVVSRTLGPGEKLLIDSHSLVAFTDGIGYDVQQVGSPLTCCLGGEGCFNTELTGPGIVYLQSLSYEKIIKLLVTQTKGAGRNKAAEGISVGAPIGGAEMQR